MILYEALSLSSNITMAYYQSLENCCTLCLLYFVKVIQRIQLQKNLHVEKCLLCDIRRIIICEYVYVNVYFEFKIVMKSTFMWFISSELNINGTHFTDQSEQMETYSQFIFIEPGETIYLNLEVKEFHMVDHPDEPCVSTRNYSKSRVSVPFIHGYLTYRFYFSVRRNACMISLWKSTHVHYLGWKEIWYFHRATTRRLSMTWMTYLIGKYLT